MLSCSALTIALSAKMNASECSGGDTYRLCRLNPQPMSSYASATLRIVCRRAVPFSSTTTKSLGLRFVPLSRTSRWKYLGVGLGARRSGKFQRLAPRESLPIARRGRPPWMMSRCSKKGCLGSTTVDSKLAATRPSTPASISPICAT